MKVLPNQQMHISQVDTVTKLFLLKLLTISTIILSIFPPAECRPSLEDDANDVTGEQRQQQNANILLNDDTITALATKGFDEPIPFSQLDDNGQAPTGQDEQVHHHRHHHRRHHLHLDQFLLGHSAVQRRRHHRRSLHADDADHMAAHEKRVSGAVRKPFSSTSGRKHRRSGGGNRLMLTKPYWPWP